MCVAHVQSQQEADDDGFEHVRGSRTAWERCMAGPRQPVFQQISAQQLPGFGGDAFDVLGEAQLVWCCLLSLLEVG